MEVWRCKDRGWDPGWQGSAHRDVKRDATVDQECTDRLQACADGLRQTAEAELRSPASRLGTLRQERGEEVKFQSGQIVATPGALDALSASGDDVLDYLERHLAGDWGDLDEHDRRENELSLQHGWRLLSAYTLSTGVKVWIVTEADRSSTCILLPSEY